MPPDRLLISVSLVIVVAYSGASMISPILVLYAQAHGASLATISVMASAFLITNFAAQYPAGWLADRTGRVRLLAFSLLLQAGTALGYLLTTDAAVLVALRGIEGIGAAATLPSARALIADSIPAQRQGAAFGLFGAAFNASFLLGPPLGGLLASVGYGNVFLASMLCRLLGVGIVLLFLPEPRGTQPRLDQPPAAISPADLLTLPLLGAYVLAFGDYLWLGFDLSLYPIWMRHQIHASLATIGLGAAAWAVPTALLSPLGGRIADRTRRSRLILLMGLAQVPLYIAYGFLSLLPVVLALFVLHGIFYALMQPAVDSHLAVASPVGARTRAQSLYSTVGLAGAFIAATTLGPIYATNVHATLPLLGLLYGLCVLCGGLLVRRWEHQQPRDPLSSRML
jgi:MFS family permease